MWFRYTLAVTAVVILVMLLFGFVRFFRNLSDGQRLWATGSIGVLIYVADGLREAASTGLAFRWRLVPLAFGLIAYVWYLVEPTVTKKEAVRQGPARAYSLGNSGAGPGLFTICTASR